MTRQAISLFDGREARSRSLYRLLWCLSVGILLVPIWLPAYNTFVDFPFHLGRAYIVRHYDSVPFFQAVFEIIRLPIPNLAIDLFLYPLLGWMDAVVAGKLFLSCYIFLFSWACHAMTMALHGRPSWISPLLAFTAYNSPMLYGFANYCFGTALFLVALSLWLRWRERSSPGKILALLVLNYLVYLSHLAAWGLLALVMSAHTLWTWWERRKICWRDVWPFAFFLPGALTFVLLPRNKLQLGGFVWNSVQGKLVAFASVFLGFNAALDAAFAALLGLAIAILIWRARWGSSRAGLFAGAAVFAAFLALPYGLASGEAADMRFFPIALLLAAASISWSLPRRWALPLYLVAFTAMGGRILEIGWNSVRIAHDTRDGIALMSQMRPFSKMAVIAMQQSDREMRVRRHIGGYAAIYRLVVPSPFCAIPGQQPLLYRHPQEWMVDNDPARFDPAYLGKHIPDFDYVLESNADEAHLEWFRSHCRLEASRGVFRLWSTAPLK